MKEENFAAILYSRGWSQDNLAKLTSTSRPRIKKILEGRGSLNHIESCVYETIIATGQTHAQFIDAASKHYIVKLLREGISRSSHA